MAAQIWFSADPANRAGVVWLYRETDLPVNDIAAKISASIGAVIDRHTVSGILREELSDQEFHTHQNRRRSLGQKKKARRSEP